MMQKIEIEVTPAMVELFECLENYKGWHTVFQNMAVAYYHTLLEAEREVPQLLKVSIYLELKAAFEKYLKNEKK